MITHKIRKAASGGCNIYNLAFGFRAACCGGGRHRGRRDRGRRDHGRQRVRRAAPLRELIAGRMRELTAAC